MILQKEIREKSLDWEVPPDTVEKDYVLGHFLAGFCSCFKDELIFKGGTCLRKCYFPGYRFSEDLDFSSINHDFKIEDKHLHEICKQIESHSGLLFLPEVIDELQHKNIKKGYQVRIRYWGANHSKNQAPLPTSRWLTKIKLEVSTEEICLLEAVNKPIHHPYSDQLINDDPIPCYDLNEIIAEKLRSLVQRSYKAPRDYYDLYMLTCKLDNEQWKFIKELFLQKMDHKSIQYEGPGQLVNEINQMQVRRAWNASIAHQLSSKTTITPDEMIYKVGFLIRENL